MRRLLDSLRIYSEISYFFKRMGKPLECWLQRMAIRLLLISCSLRFDFIIFFFLCIYYPPFFLWTHLNLYFQPSPPTPFYDEEVVKHLKCLMDEACKAGRVEIVQQLLCENPFLLNANLTGVCGQQEKQLFWDGDTHMFFFLLFFLNSLEPLL